MPYVKNDSGVLDTIDSSDYTSTVDSDGNGKIDLTAYFEDKDAGDYEVTFMDNGLNYEKTVTVTVTEATELTSITATIDKDSLTVGEGAIITVTPDEDYTGDTPEYSYEVEVSNDSTYVVDNYLGEGEFAMYAVYAMTETTVTVTITADDYEGVSTTVTFTVSPKTFSPKTYEVVEGNGATWTRGSSDGMTVRIDADINEFAGVWVMTKYAYDLWAEAGFDYFRAFDGWTEEEWNANFFIPELDEDYTIEEGSTIITFKPAFLESLGNGEYVYLANYYDGGFATGTFTIANATSDTTPDTGVMTKSVEAATTANGAVAAVSALAAGAFLAMRKRFTRK